MAYQPQYVVFGWQVVPLGGQAIIVDANGNVETVDGPTRKFLWCVNFQLLKRFAANEGQYLAIKYLDGRSEHLPGPAVVFLHPFRHAGITVQKKLTVNSGFAVAVYGTEMHGQDVKLGVGDKQAVTRKIVHGPEQYTPEVGEWLHKFHWSMPNQLDPRQPHVAMTFHKLRTVPDQMLFEVQGVRTNDDALLSLNFMVFYRLVDIDKMLDNTHDPCGDVCSTLTADAMDFVGQRSFEEFKTDSDRLNLLDTFPQLASRMEACGYHLIKVAYRGYGSSQALQEMHNNAIEKRTALKLEQETEEQKQGLEDMKQERENHRKKKEQEQDHQTQAHDDELKRKQVEQDIERNKLVFQADLEQKERAHHAELSQQSESAASRNNEEQMAISLQVERQKKLDEIQIAMLTTLHEKVGLDVTQFMVAQGEKADQKIKVVSSTSGNSPDVHLHSKL